MNGYVDIPRDLSEVKAKVFLNLTKRQLVCFGAGIGLGAPLYLWAMGPLGTSAATLLMLPVMLPCFLMGMYEKHGRPLEKIVGDMVRARYLRPRTRPYQTKNYYTLLQRQRELDEEVERIIARHYGVVEREKGMAGTAGPGKAPEPGGKEGDPKGRRTCPGQGERADLGPGEHPL